MNNFLQQKLQIHRDSETARTWWINIEVDRFVWIIDDGKKRCLLLSIAHFDIRYYSTEIESAERTHTRDLMSEHLKSTLKFQHSTSTENSIKHYRRF